MTNRQNSKLASYHAVEALLKATTETAGIPGLPASLTALSGRIDELNTLGETQLQPTRPKVAWRDAQLEEMIEASLAVAGVVSTHAHRHNLHELAGEMEVREGSFQRLPRAQRRWLAQRIHDLAQPVLPQLAPLGVTAETLAELQAKITAADEAMNQPRTTIASKRGATARMAGLFREADRLLEREIDGQVFSLRKTSAGFYAAYQAARHVQRRRYPADAATPAAPPLTAATAAPAPLAAEKLAA